MKKDEKEYGRLINRLCICPWKANRQAIPCEKAKDEMKVFRGDVCYTKIREISEPKKGWGGKKALPSSW